MSSPAASPIAGPNTRSNRISWAAIVFAVASCVGGVVNFLENDKNQEWITRTVNSLAILIPGTDRSQQPIAKSELGAAIQKVGEALSLLKADQMTGAVERVEQGLAAQEQQLRITEMMQLQLRTIGPQMREDDASIMYSTLGGIHSSVVDSLCETRAFILRTLASLPRSSSPEEQVMLDGIRERLSYLRGTLDARELDCGT